MPSPPRSSRERARLQVDERRSQLLELGLQLFSDHSYDELSIDDIARAAGISKGLLYHYFPSKRDYYVEVVRRAAGQLIERTDAASQEVSVEALHGALDAYLDFVDQHARSYVALVRGGIGSDPEVVQLLEATRRTLTERIVSRISADEPPPLLRLALRGWIGLVESASLDWLDRREVPREQLRGLLEQMLVATIMAAGVTPPVL
ncbi:TetR/AcrR family transcriptional regulator [Nannocystis sp.]|uniref:TetR/AcrR family transcriptional regulator n=1 Tax=Nannocystis sp. TaxID=1962667 RepID=UPI002421F04A|nr:TetR/AcrR family transcriptional regulator [Nannocystis sp.]MBK7824030.1 TetR/AcrR family transcriptional regulator [Nannocystis sp.]MBK9755045.1 TetR/AcrR family transcriptional regulator [Nannocystis sp.]